MNDVFRISLFFNEYGSVAQRFDYFHLHMINPVKQMMQIEEIIEMKCTMET